LNTGAVNPSPTIVISSGEMSGDMHAAILVRSLRERLPGARIAGMGGDRCRDAGAELLYHYRDYAILGFTEVLANLPRLLRLKRGMERAIAGADLFVAVDYPGLNLRLADHARRRGVPVLYYIGPQVWAWGAGRLDRMAGVVDRMAVILPFEEPLYRDKGIAVEFVGHPFVVDHEMDPPLPQSERSGVGLLPGSREQEVSRILPALLGAASRIRERFPDEPFVVGRSSGVAPAVYDRIIADARVGVEVSDDPIGVMRASRLLLVASGTATLQGALAETPLVIVYKVSPLNYLLARRLIRIEQIGLINVILGEPAAPELIQSRATPGAIAELALDLLENREAREAMVGKFRRARGMLSGGGGTRRVAEIAAELVSP
jgi:lipid-A-disaccharide synthase